MKTTYDEIQNIIQTWEGHPYDACMEIIQKIKNGSIEPWRGIKETLSNPIRIGNNDADLYNLPKDDLNRYIYRYQDYIIKLVEALAMKDYEEDTFYKELYTHVFDSDIIPEDEIFQALYLYLLSDRIKLVPYYQTKDALILKEEEYKDVFETIRPQLNMAFHMCSRKFDTKSETASQYWEIASTLLKREEQIVFWAVVMEMEKKNMKNNDE